MNESSTQVIFNIPYLSDEYYLHLHGLHLEQDLISLVNKSNNKFYYSDRGAPGLCTHKVFKQEILFLRNNKHKGFRRKFKDIPLHTVGHCLSFVDNFTTEPSTRRNIVSLRLNRNDILESFSDFEWQSQALFEITYTCNLLRILGLKFISPFISNLPYSRFFNNTNEELKIVILDLTSIRHSFRKGRDMTIEDTKWINENQIWFKDNFEELRIHISTALDMILSAIYVVDPTVLFTNSWIGIDSLLKPEKGKNNSKIFRERLSHSSSNLISARRVKKLQQIRNDIIHGNNTSDNMKNEDMDSVAQEVSNLLCNLMKYYVENKIIPDKMTLDELYVDCVESIPYDEPNCVSCGNLLRCENCDE